MNEYELIENGWKLEVDGYWYHSDDIMSGGFLYERAHTLEEAICRQTEATLKSVKVGAVRRPNRSISDGIEMGFIHPPKKGGE